MDTKSGDKFKKSVDKMACVEMDTNSGVMFTKTVDKIWPCRYVHNIYRERHKTCKYNACSLL